MVSSGCDRFIAWAWIQRDDRVPPTVPIHSDETGALQHLQSAVQCVPAHTERLLNLPCGNPELITVLQTRQVP
jgi:hypothetical protein